MAGVDKSAGGCSGVGDCNSISVVTAKGALWGRGDMSIESLAGPGDDEGNGGVVIDSRRL